MLVVWVLTWIQIGKAVHEATMALARPGQEINDLYFDWAKLREVAEDGAVLVRPDKHIGWRADRLPTDPEAALLDTVSAILNRGA